MRDPWWDVTEEEWVARWGSSGMVPELLAWWRKEKARRDARTPEEVAAEENALAQQRAQEAVWEAEARAAQVERHEDKERTEKLIARICPSQDRGKSRASARGWMCACNPSRKRSAFWRQSEWRAIRLVHTSPSIEDGKHSSTGLAGRWVY